MRIIFMGSPEFALPALDALIASPHEIVAAYTQPPRPAGRGKAPRPTPIHTRAHEAGLPVFHPDHVRSPEEIERIISLNADLAVVVAYGLILPQEILDAPRFGAINIHASLLPRWRGAAPIARAIEAGDEKSGVSLMRMEKGLDSGPVYAVAEQPIPADMIAGELHDHLARLGARLLMEKLERLPDMTPTPQPEEGISYAAKIEKSETKINWQMSAEAVRRHIHALSPFPGAWSMLEGERIKFVKVEEVDAQGKAGEIIDMEDGGILIACKEGAIRPLVIQREGKRPMPIEDALRGMRLQANIRFDEQ